MTGNPFCAVTVALTDTSGDMSNRVYVFHKPILFPLKTKEKTNENKQLYGFLAFKDALASKCLIQFWQQIFHRGIGRQSLLP